MYLSILLKVTSLALGIRMSVSEVNVWEWSMSSLTKTLIAQGPLFTNKTPSNNYWDRDPHYKHETGDRWIPLTKGR